MRSLRFASHRIALIALNISNVTHLEERVTRRGLKEEQHSVVLVWFQVQQLKRECSPAKASKYQVPSDGCQFGFSW